MPHFHPAVFKYAQSTPSDTWIIQHNLGGNGSQGIPMVDVYIDYEGTRQKVLCNVTMTNRNTCTLEFSVPRTGEAIIIV